MNDNFVIDISSEFEKGGVESDGRGKIDGKVGTDFDRVPKAGCGFTDVPRRPLPTERKWPIRADEDETSDR